MGVDDRADGPSDDELPLLALLQRGVRWFSEALTNGLAREGVDPITPAHAMVLAHVEPNSTLSVAELARRAGVSRQTMHRAVMQLVDEGLLTSLPGSGFPRSTSIELTAEGAHRRQVARRILRELELSLAERLGPAGTVDLRSALTRAWPENGGEGPRSC